MVIKNKHTHKYANELPSKNLFLYPTLAITTITSISALTLISSSVSADDVVDNVSITVPVSCTMSGTGMNSHSAEVVNSTYRADIGTTTIKAFCNDPNGFSIYAIGFTNDEYTGTNHTKLIGTNDSTKTIATGTATSGNDSNWAMKLATNSSATYPITLTNGYGSYSNVPDTYTKVAQRTSGTDTGESATGSELTTTYAAFISSTQAADTYVGKVKYTMVHPYDEIPLQPQPATAGCINYFANGSGVTGEMGCQSVSNNVSVDLWAANFKRNGYGFAGWNTEFDYSGTTYGPNQDIITPSDVSTKGLSLYAVWVKSAGSLQNWSGCSSLAEGAVTALTDERDGDTYAVAKLADGKCWMIENLRLDDSAELSSANTHNPSLPLTNVYSEDPTTSNHLSPTTDPTQTAWCTTNSSACDDQSMLATNNTTLYTNNTASNYDASSNVYSYGNYYNWYSATAGNGKYSTSSTVSGDICPAGWHLPTGSTAGEFYVLNTAVAGSLATSYGLRSYPNNFVYSGDVNGSRIVGRNSTGFYRSASGGSEPPGDYPLSFSNLHVDPGTTKYYRYYGEMVRCLVGS